MNQYNNHIRTKTLLLYGALLFRNGLRRLWAHKRGLFIAYPAAVVCLQVLLASLPSTMETPFFAVLTRVVLLLFNPPFALVVAIAGIIRAGMPANVYSVNDNLRRAGLTNSVGESPLLVSVCDNADFPNIQVLDLLSLGVTPADVEAIQANVEAALDRYIVKAEHGQSLRRLLLHVVPAGEALPADLPWRGGHWDNDPAVVVLGEDLTRQPVKVNLDVTPHVMFGGDSGSGKTNLLKLLLAQCKMKGAEVIIADRKGGMDFFADFWQTCPLHTENPAIEQALAELAKEVKRRFPLFKAAKCDNLTAYNRKMAVEGEAQLTRIVFACDEASQLLDRTGLPKQEKDEIEVISSHLKEIARLGRSVGVHLVLAQQRPSADVIPGDLKNNMSFRACGRADDTLSRIILDNGDAATRIPKDSRGRFLTNGGVLFQAYKLDEGEAFREGGHDHDRTD